MTATDFEGLLRRLVEGGVEFILVGGVAAVVHGSARATFDLDVVYSRNPDNLGRVAEALAGIQPYLRGAPPGLPFSFDIATLQRGLNFTLTTRMGDLDLLGDIVGGGSYEDLLPFTEIITIFGFTCRCIGLTKLIAVKRAAGRPKDNEILAELQALREERDRLDGRSDA